MLQDSYQPKLQSFFHI